MIPRPGETIGPFSLVRLLGQGGMGAVFIARHPSGAEVALKVLTAEGDEASQFLERFKREIAAMVRVDRHPGIVRVHTAGVHQGRPYVVMELVRGTDLSKVIGKKPLDPERAAVFVEKVARAVHHCHEQGVIHRDLKPANILVRAEDQEPLVTDFGLARDDSAERLTRTGELLGTPAYMAPEQVEGDPKAQDRRTDVYALGAILYECLTGGPPFQAESQMQLVKKVLVDEPQDPRRTVPELPQDLCVIALKCLEKERLLRYPSALAVAEELARFQAGEPIVARPESFAEKLRRRLRRRRKEGLLGLVGLAGLLVAGCVLAYLGARRVQLEGAKAEREARLAEAASVASARGFPRLLDSVPEDAAAAVARLKSARERFEALGGKDAPGALERWAELCSDPKGALGRATETSDPLVPVLDAAAATRLYAQSHDSRALLEAEKRLPDAKRVVLVHLRGLFDHPAVSMLAELADGCDRLAPEEKAAWRVPCEEAAASVLEATLKTGAPRDPIAMLVPALERLGDPRRLVPVAESADERAFVRLAGEPQTRSFPRLQVAARLALFLDPVPGANPRLARKEELLALALDDVVVACLGEEQAVATQKVLRSKALDQARQALDLMRRLRRSPRPQTIDSFYGRFSDPSGYRDASDVVGHDALLLALGIAQHEVAGMKRVVLRGTSRVPATDQEKLLLAAEVYETAKPILEKPEDPHHLLAALRAAYWTSTEFDSQADDMLKRGEEPGALKLAEKSRKVEDEARVLFARHWRDSVASLNSKTTESFLRAVERYEEARCIIRLRIDVRSHEDPVSPRVFERLDAALRAAEAARSLGHPRPWDAERLVWDIHQETLKRLVAKNDLGRVEGEAEKAVEAARRWEKALAEARDAVRRLHAKGEGRSFEEELKYRTYTDPNLYNVPEDAEVGMLAQPCRARADAYAQVVECFFSADQRARARPALGAEIAALDEALSITADQQMTHLQLAEALYQKWELDHARPDLDRALLEVKESLSTRSEGLKEGKRNEALDLKSRIESQK